jgi:radical SAM superfamily enzyme YgiQ (UPF0313 family)
VDGRPALIQNIRNYIENNGRIVDPVKGENENHWHCAPKLNGIVLMSHLLKEGFTVELIDSYYDERDRFVEHLKCNPKAVIISTTFIINKSTLARLVEDIRLLAGDIYIIAGGPFVYSSYLLLKRAGDGDYDTASPARDFLFLTGDDRPDVDLFIVDARGEWILSAILDRIIQGRTFSDLPNHVRWEDGEYVFSPRGEYGGRQSGLLVDWDVIPERFFASGVMNVQASRGCPFHCEFCNFVKDEKDTHIKPIDALVSELSGLSRRGVKYVRFVDDNFRLGKNDLNTVCQAFIRTNLDIRWMSFIRAGTLANTDLELLKRAGCIDVQIGVESADRNILKNMNKRADPDMYIHVIGDLLNAGINCSCFFLVGFPGETEASFQKTLDFIESIPGPGQSGLFCWTIFSFLLAPLSPVYEPSKRALYDLSGYMDRWKHFSMDSDTARRLIRKAFGEIRHSGPIYSGDNLEMLAALAPGQKKQFFNLRHSLEKRIAEASQDRRAVIDSFSSILSSDSSGLYSG